MSRGRNHFEPASFALGTTYNERTTKFLGVDLTSPQMEVDLKRGIASNNYLIKKTGKVETRFGYKTVFNDPDYIVYGVWEMNRGGASRDTSIIGVVLHLSSEEGHEGTGHIEFVIFEQDGEFIEIASTFYADAGYVSPYEGDIATAANGVVSQGRLWLLALGDYWVIEYDEDEEDFAATRVALWENTHVPTVTYMGVAMNAKNVPAVTNVTLEYPNLLSRYRIDKFLTGLGVADDTGNYPMFKLQGNVDLEYPVEIKLETNKEPLTTAICKQLLADCAPSSDASPDFAQFCAKYMKEGDILFGFSDEFDAFDPEQYANYEFEDTAENNIYITGTDAFVDGIIHKEEDGSTTLILIGDPIPMVQGRPNLFVKYAWMLDETFAQNYSLVTENSIMALFGKNNSLNRLWLAGHPDRPNYAIHSAEPYKDDGNNLLRGEADFSYFPDEGIIKFGEKDNAIVGMIPLSPDKMMVLKNKGGYERTVYFVAPYDVNQLVASAGTYGTLTLPNDLTITREEYSTTMSNTSTAGFTHKTVDVFNGDTLFLSSEKQVVGLEIEGITGDSQRVAYTRSHFIDGKIMSANMNNARLFHNGNYLFLSTADKLYISSWESLSSETKQYEWWPCDPIPGNVCFANELLNGTLLIGTDDGKIFTFEEDREERVDENTISVSETHNITVVNDQCLVTANGVASQITDDSKATSDISEDDLWSFEYEMDKQWAVANGARYLPNVLCASVDTSELSYYPRSVAPGVTRDKVTLTGTLMKMADAGFEFVAYHLVNDSTFTFYKFEFYGYTSDGSQRIYQARDTGTNELLDSVFDIYNSSYGMAAVVPETGLYAFSELSQDETYYLTRLYWRGNDGSFNFLPLEDTTKKLGRGKVIDKASFSVRKRIVPYFATLRLTQGKLGYDKTIDNLTLWNDSDTPCELYVGSITNTQAGTVTENAVLDQGKSYNFQFIDYTNTGFDSPNAPKFYNLRKFPRSKQSFTLCFTAKSKRNSVLSGVDILYRVKKARNKR